MVTDSKPFEAAGRLAKSGQGTDELQADAVGDIARMLGLGLGAGAAWRGGQGLYHLLQRNLGYDTIPTSPGPIRTEVPIPSQPEREDEASEEKRSQDLPDQFPFAPLGNSKVSIPAYLPAVIGAGGLGLYGGHKTLDYLMDRRREEEQEQELESARDQFRQALLDDDDDEKTGSDNRLGQALDRLYDRLKSAQSAEKQGEGESPEPGWINWLSNVDPSDWLPSKDTVGNVGGATAGSYGLYALPTALLAGHWAYNQARDKDPAKILEDARKRQIRRQFNRRPPSVYAVPEYVDEEEER